MNSRKQSEFVRALKKIGGGVHATTDKIGEREKIRGNILKAACEQYRQIIEGQLMTRAQVRIEGNFSFVPFPAMRPILRCSEMVPSESNVFEGAVTRSITFVVRRVDHQPFFSSLSVSQAENNTQSVDRSVGRSVCESIARAQNIDCTEKYNLIEESLEVSSPEMLLRGTTRPWWSTRRQHGFHQ